MFTSYGNFAGGYSPGSMGEGYQSYDQHKESNMGSDAVNVFTPPAGGDGGSGMIPAAIMAGMGGRNNDGFGGGGIGAGLVGGLIGGMIFGGGGRFGFGDRGGDCGRGHDCLTPEMAATTAMGLNTAIGGTTAAVMASTDKLAMGQMQIMQGVSSGFANQGQMTLQQTIMMIQQMNLNQQTLLSELCGVNQNVSAQGCQTREAVVADGDRTRALLTSRFQLEDATEINKLNAKVIELSNESRHRELASRIEITNTNTAVAAQQQQQAQVQFQFQDLNNKLVRLCDITNAVHQEARATNSNVIAGNTGAVTTGAQTSTPTNTSVNA